VLSFEAIIFWPVTLYFILVHPAWAWMYLVDPRRLPVGMSALVLVADVAALVGGYLAGWALLRAQKERILLGALGVFGVAVIVFAVMCRGRLMHDGSFAEYHAGHALSLAEGKIGWALAATSAGTAVAVALVGFTLWEQGKRSRS
jgi:hypothetical protein